MSSHMRETFWHFLPAACMFSAILFAFLCVSALSVVPLLTHIELTGSVHDVSQMQQRHQELSHTLHTKRQERSSLVIPLQDEQYRELIDAKETRLSPNALLRKVRRTAHAAAGSARHIAWESERFNVRAQTLTLQGRIEGVGQRSMTVLAQVFDALTKLPEANTVQAPEFVRKERRDGTLYSPFTITLEL